MGEAVEHFSYDLVGNRLSDNVTTGSWTYNKNNELQNFDTTSFKYNLNGQLTEKTLAGNTTTLVYNLDGRLKEIKDNSSQTIATYQYDPFGRRISKTLSKESKIIYYHYSNEGLVGEFNESGGLIQSYGYAPGSPFTTNPLYTYRPDFAQDKGYAYYINDLYGLPQQLITNTGRTVWKGHTDSFGKTFTSKNEFRNPLRFPGQFEDDESGLYYNFKRFYDPQLGRYIKSDPLGLGGGINSYGYVYGNPINAYDPHGELVFGIPVWMWIVGGGAVAVGASTVAANDPDFIDACMDLLDKVPPVKPWMQTGPDDKTPPPAGPPVPDTAQPPMPQIPGDGDDDLPPVKKAVNSNMPHAVSRGVQRGVFPNKNAASQGLKDLTKGINKNGFPKGTIRDPAHADRVLVPVGNNGKAAYQVGKNGTAKLKTVLNAK